MSTVNRSIVVNPIEPHPLSMRVDLNTDTQLNVVYYRQSGLPLNVDVDGQLVLTGRTTKATSFFSLPATDIANGKAGALIPAGSLTDPNGYQLTIYGSTAGVVGVLARGVLTVDAIEAPSVAPIDVIDQVPLSFDRSLTTDTSFTVRLWDDSSKSDPYDLSLAVVQAAIYRGSNHGEKLTDFAVTPIDANSVTISLTPTQIVALPDDCWWSLQIAAAGGSTTLCEGTVTVTGTALPPLLYNLMTVGGVSAASTDTFTTDSFTPPLNSLIVVLASSLVPNGHSTASTITSSAGLTFIKQKEQITINAANPWCAGVEIWTAPAVASVPMTITVDFNASNNDNGGYYQLYVVAFTGYDATSPVAQVFGDGGTAGRTGSYSATWPSTPNAENFILTATGDNSSIGATVDNVTPGVDFTLIGEVAAPAGFFQSLAQYRTQSASTTISMNNFTVPGALAWSIAGIEIRGQRQA